MEVIPPSPFFFSSSGKLLYFVYILCPKYRNVAILVCLLSFGLRRWNIFMLSSIRKQQLYHSVRENVVSLKWSPKRTMVLAGTPAVPIFNRSQIFLKSFINSFAIAVAGISYGARTLDLFTVGRNIRSLCTRRSK